jgi:glycosyltransferase involved in cell wall biosynthesis
MKILFFSHYFPPEGNAPAARTYENCRQWAREGHKVTVITCAPNVPGGVVYDGYKNRLFGRQKIDGIDVVRVWTYIAPNEGFIRRVINYLSYLISAVFFSLFIKRPDVIIATSPQFFCGWAGVLASRLRNIPFILEIRDLWPESITAVGAIKNKRLLRFLERLEIKMYSAANQIVTVGEGYKQKLLERGVPAEKISVIPNGIDPDVFYPREPDPGIMKRYGLEKKFVCSYIGTIGMACGLEVVIEAAGILKKRGLNEAVFLLVGDGASRKGLERQAGDKKLDNIIFAGRQDKEQIPAFLSASNACLVHLKKTRLFETVMPSKIFEAASMAKPVILGVAGCAADLVKDAGAGICIEPENAQQLADAVTKLVFDSELCRRLGQAGQKYVIRYHDRNILAQNYIETIISVCNPEPKPQAVLVHEK